MTIFFVYDTQYQEVWGSGSTDLDEMKLKLDGLVKAYGNHFKIHSVYV